MRSWSAPTLARSDPYARSGGSGTPVGWWKGRRTVALAMARDGDLPDPGCAVGRLATSLVDRAEKSRTGCPASRQMVGN